MSTPTPTLRKRRAQDDLKYLRLAQTEPTAVSKTPKCQASRLILNRCTFSGPILRCAETRMRTRRSRGFHLRSMGALGTLIFVWGGFAVPTGLSYSYLTVTAGNPALFSVPYAAEPWFSGRREVVLLDSPLWEEHGTDVRDLATLVEESVRVWSSIETADLDLRFALFQAEDGSAGTIIVRPNEFETFAFQLSSSAQGPIDECGVNLHAGILASGPSTWIKNTIIHELGHCLGLSHTPVFVPQIANYKPPPVWREDPIMSYGNYGDGTITLDDRIGVSLLWPRAGWIETTGSIQGRVLKESVGVGFVTVVATRLHADGAMAESVGVLTDSDGGFEIRGLPPGDYTLLVRQRIVESAYSSAYLLRHFDHRIRGAFWADTVSVRAGTAARSVMVSLRGSD